MPELPEVETVKRGISPYVLNQQISKIIVREPRLRWLIPKDLPKKFQGTTVVDITRRSKYLLLRTQAGTLLIHLGMSGTLRVIKAKDTVNITVAKHDHFDIVFNNGCILRYNDPRRFGCFLWVDNNPDQDANDKIPRHKLLDSLGPEPLSKAFTAEHLYKLAQKRRIAIKLFIMDAKVVVGVGNIYANEALFKARIHPEKPCHQLSLDDFKLLTSQIKQTLKKAIQQGGTTLRDFTQADGKPGYFVQQLQVYGRKGEQCTHCANPIEEIRLGQRSTFYCAHCQS